MKRLIILFFTFCSMTFLSAQTHMSFMGIPLDGHVNSFAEKIKEKGFTVYPLYADADSDYDEEFGYRIYKGKYSGYESDLWVNYGRHNGIVYNVRVTLFGNKETLEATKAKIQDVIEKNYIWQTQYMKNTGSRASGIYSIYETPQSKEAYGEIYIKVSEPSFFYSSYTLEITYEDLYNSKRQNDYPDKSPKQENNSSKNILITEDDI